MKLIVDTQVWLWTLVDDARLGRDARKILSARKNEPLLSAASAWEIAIKFRLGKLPLPADPEAFVPSRLLRDRIGSLPVDVRHALRVASLPALHRDPFDRLLVAQGQIEDLPILTADPWIGRYDVAVIAATE